MYCASHLATNNYGNVATPFRYTSVDSSRSDFHWASTFAHSAGEISNPSALHSTLQNLIALSCLPCVCEFLVRIWDRIVRGGSERECLVWRDLFRVGEIIVDAVRPVTGRSFCVRSILPCAGGLGKTVNFFALHFLRSIDVRQHP